MSPRAILVAPAIVAAACATVGACSSPPAPDTAPRVAVLHLPAGYAEDDAWCADYRPAPARLVVTIGEHCPWSDR